MEEEKLAIQFYLEEEDEGEEKIYGYELTNGQVSLLLAKTGQGLQQKDLKFYAVAILRHLAAELEKAPEPKI